MGKWIMEILSVRRGYFGKSMVFGLFLAAVLWMLAQKKQKAEIKVLGYGSAAAVLILLNPLAIHTYFAWIYDKGLYYKLIWLLPLVPVLGFVFTEAVSCGRKKREKAALLAALSILIIISGSLAFSYGAFEKRDSKEKLKAEIMDIVPYIEAGMEESGEEVRDESKGKGEGGAEGSEIESSKAGKSEAENDNGSRVESGDESREKAHLEGSGEESREKARPEGNGEESGKKAYPAGTPQTVYAAVTDSLLPDIRNYTVNVTLLYSRTLTADNSTICYLDEEMREKAEAVRKEINAGVVDPQALAKAAKEARVSVIVLDAGTCDVQAMEAAGYSLAGYNTKYEVYKW